MLQQKQAANTHPAHHQQPRHKHLPHAHQTPHPSPRRHQPRTASQVLPSTHKPAPVVSAAKVSRSTLSSILVPGVDKLCPNRNQPRCLRSRLCPLSPSARRCTTKPYAVTFIDFCCTPKLPLPKPIRPTRRQQYNSAATTTQPSIACIAGSCRVGRRS